MASIFGKLVTVTSVLVSPFLPCLVFILQFFPLVYLIYLNGRKLFLFKYACVYITVISSGLTSSEKATEKYICLFVYKLLSHSMHADVFLC